MNGETQGLEAGDAACFPDAARAEAAPSRVGPLAALGALYFVFGFITCLNDILIPHLKEVFRLDYTRAMLIQSSFFSAYFVMSLPSGWLVDRRGYQRGMVSGLLGMAAGCLLFLPAAAARSYPLFLLAVFLLASGITLLQVAANPYVAALGRPETASSRLTLTQGFNSLGTTVAPLFGSALILAGGAGAVRGPYLGLAGALVLLAGLTARLRLPGIEPARAEAPAPSPWRNRPLMLGALGIFLYVGAEVGIGSFLVNYLHHAGHGTLSLARAARCVSLYWGGAMAGRFLGSAAMRALPPGAALCGSALAALALVLTALAGSGPVSMVAILAVGLFNSIMFPTLFTLAIRGLDRGLGRASGILCMAIVGGALVPVVQGVLADRGGLRMAFVPPALCYAYIACYGAAGRVPAAGRRGL